MAHHASGVLHLHWYESDRGRREYNLYELLPSGQMKLLDSWDAGPFCTDLEAGERLLRNLTRALNATHG